MENATFKISQETIWGTALVATGALIFFLSLLITLGGSVSDGTAWVCGAFCCTGAVLLARGATRPTTTPKES